MKRFLNLLSVPFVAVVLLFIPGCKKSNTPGGAPTLNIFYPATMSFYEGSNSAYPTVWKYEYNADHNLVKYGKENESYREVAANGVNAVWYDYTFNYVGMNTYSFSFGSSQTVRNIYNGSPSEVRIDNFRKDMTSGVTSSQHVADHSFAVNVDGLLLKEILPEANARNYNYNYDETKNLKLVEYVEDGRVYTRIKVTGLEDNPAPFVAVKGYQWASYPQNYASEIGFAFFNRCPKQFVMESYDPASDSYKISEKDDFSYVFNENGWPTQVSLTTTYYGANNNTSVFTKVYNFTYTQ